jgi:hypothetical protein
MDKSLESRVFIPEPLPLKSNGREINFNLIENEVKNFGELKILCPVMLSPFDPNTSMSLIAEKLEHYNYDADTDYVLMYGRVLVLAYMLTVVFHSTSSNIKMILHSRRNEETSYTVKEIDGSFTEILK